MADDMFLYWGSGSVPCWKAMIALEEKGFHGYPNKRCHFEKGEHKSEEIMKLNPRGQLPVFKHGDLVICESGAIASHLTVTFPKQGNSLLPEDVAFRSRVFQKKYEIVNMDKHVHNIIAYKYHTKKEDRDEDLLKSYYENARKELGFWESSLKKEEGPYIAGKEFTLADVQFFPYIAIGFRCGLNLNSYPYIKAYYERLTERPSIKASWPPHWKETEGDMTILGPV